MRGCNNVASTGNEQKNLSGEPTLSGSTFAHHFLYGNYPLDLPRTQDASGK